MVHSQSEVDDMRFILIVLKVNRDEQDGEGENGRTIGTRLGGGDRGI